MAKNVCFVGASTVEGVGDEVNLGWPGRLRRLEQSSDLTFHNLGIRGQSSRQIAERWLSGCAPLLPNERDIMVVSFGNNDIAELGDGQTRVPFQETIETCAQVIRESSRWRPTYWVGPLPVDEAKMPFYSSALQRDLFFRNSRIAELNGRFESMATTLDVPYLDLFSVLCGDPSYAEAVASKDGLHPNGNGYQLIAHTIAAWKPWRHVVDGTIAVHGNA
jgi:lysophospholipase L1-like esterase